MSWNYRVVKHTDKDDGYTWFDIYEVYHNGDDELSWTVDCKSPTGNSLDELRADLNKMLVALDYPVLKKKGRPWLGNTLVEVELK